ncbi:MAG: cation diffusion facilitator family transporter [Candidatus Nanopelagicales bacterium]|nr:cation diffusion facilitator family transporter [Candidatus Nanopelagicales bacterium]
MNFGLGLGISVVVVQLVGAWFSSSLALVADAVHMFADVFGILLALAAVTAAARPSKPRHTFGLYRLEILAAVVNGLLLFGLAIFIFKEAVERWFNPVEVVPGFMIAAACYGVAANVTGLVLLRKGSETSLTIKGAYLEVLSDTLGSLGVVVAGVVVLLTGYERIDSIMSVGIALFMVPRTVLLLKRALSVLLESAPPGLDLDEVRRHLIEVEGVIDVHDVHAWTITSGMACLSAHVVVDPGDQGVRSPGDVLEGVTDCARECFDLRHTTFQLESAQYAAAEEKQHN